MDTRIRCTFRLIAFAGLVLIDRGGAFAQPTATLVGNKVVYFPASGSTSGLQERSLPIPTDPIAIANGHAYTGAVPTLSQFVQLDDRGRILFFVIDGHVYDRDGYLIADPSDEPLTGLDPPPFADGLLKEGRGEVVAAPVPGRCGMWYLVHSVGPSTNSAHKVGFSVLDLDRQNPLFPNDQDRHGKLLDNIECVAAGYNFTSVLFNLNGSGELPPDPPSSDDTNGAVQLEVVHVAATGRTFLLISTGYVLGKYELTSTEVDFLGFDQLATDPALSPDAPAAKGEVEAHANGTQVFVALSYMRLRFIDEPGVYEVRYVPHIHISEHNASSSTLARVGLPVVVADPSIAAGSTSFDALGRAIRNPGIGGLEFSANGRYVYWMKSYGDSAPGYDHVGCWDRQTNSPVPLESIEPLPFLDGKIERHISPDGQFDALYVSGTLSNGTHVLGALLYPDVPDAANWVENAFVTSSTTLCTDGSLQHPDASTGRDPYHLLDKQGYNDQSIPLLTTEECCDTKHRITGFTNYEVEAGNHLWTATQNPFYDLSEVRISGELRIKTGATVVANDITFSFAPGAEMIIERGAKFTSDGCTFKAGCEERWTGIRVEGNTYNNNQSTIQGAPLTERQGWLWLIDGSVVEDARTGVLCGRPGGPQGYDPAYFGGVVYATNSTFRNCVVGVNILRYTRIAQNMAEGDNLSRFINCSFVTDQGWLEAGSYTPKYFAQLDDVHGVRFTNCSFRNTAPELFTPGEQGWGIWGYLSGFHVTGNETPTTAFEGLAVGVIAYTGLQETYTVDRMHLQNNMWGIYDLAGLAPRITRNNFLVPDQGSYPNPTMGLVLHQSSAYVVEQNLFFGNTGQNSVGIYFIGPQFATNQIYNNEFAQLLVGTMVYGRHKSNDDQSEFQGLQILCGDYIANLLDHALGPYTYVRENQGQVDGEQPDESQLAGNRWFDPYVAGRLDIWIDPDQHEGQDEDPMPFFDYFRHADQICDPLETSPYYADIEVLLAGPFTKEGSCGNGDIQPIPDGPGVVRTRYLNAAAELRSAVVQFHSTVNNGMGQEDLIKQINKKEPYHASHVLRDMLLSASPVTDPVLVAMLQRGLPMNTWHMVQVLVANKPLSNQVFTVVGNSGYFSTYQKGLMEGSSQSGEVLKLLKAEIGTLGEHKARLQRHMVNQLLTDSLETERWSAFITTIGASPDFADKFLMHAVHLQHGAVTQAQDWLDSLEAVSPKDIVVLEMLTDLRDDLGTAWPYARQQDWAVLEPQIDRLEAGAAWARSMAYQAEHTRKLPVLPLPDPNKSRQVMGRERDASLSALERGAKLFPNPANDHTFLVLDEALEGALNMRLVDALGGVVTERTFSNSGQVFQVDLAGLAQGSYVCEIMRDGMDKESIQLVVTK